MLFHKALLAFLVSIAAVSAFPGLGILNGPLRDLTGTVGGVFHGVKGMAPGNLDLGDLVDLDELLEQLLEELEKIEKIEDTLPLAGEPKPVEEVDNDEANPEDTEDVDNDKPNFAPEEIVYGVVNKVKDTASNVVGAASNILGIEPRPEAPEDVDNYEPESEPAEEVEDGEAKPEAPEDVDNYKPESEPAEVVDGVVDKVKDTASDVVGAASNILDTEPKPELEEVVDDGEPKPEPEQVVDDGEPKPEPEEVDE
ncbi:hypothetical protein B9Z55_016125 [Caenorhabditis nigoni]|uniref:SXP/RAL-2 family protein Ani s 5-like cation-binding domain-containing protein n=1 Tax=Caenorhabditis nigoni TaxID=1611254 RepID=A0A2G5UDD5_9PELO|nr:hypothetical protein B9Z55_016125 [Caenorhabditis nigoni]